MSRDRGTAPQPSADGRTRLRSLAQLARAMAEPRAIEDLVEVAAHEIRFALDATSVEVGRLERERGQVRVLCVVGSLGPDQRLRPTDLVLHLSEVPTLARLVEEAAPFCRSVPDPGEHDPDPAHTEHLAAAGRAHAVGAPILVDGRVWGLVHATRDAATRPFGSDDVAHLEALAAVMASGVAQASRVSLVERLAYEDPLTGLANRRAVDLRLEEALDARNAGGRPVSVVMADVNGLKRMNDERGHEAGDRVLATVADALSIAVTQVPAGLAGRIGGDEFCLVLEGLDGEEAARVAQSVMDRLDEGPYAGALSCGVASSTLAPPGEPVTPRQLLRWADEAQYTAKRARLRVPVVAGRDTLLVDPDERRSLRGNPPAGGATGAPPADLTRQALTLGLAAAARAGADPKLRLVRALDAVCDALGATGWVLSQVEDGATRTVAFAQSGETARPESSARLSPEVVERAGRTGVLARPGDVTSDLAETRGTAAVAAAVVGPWLLELLGDDVARLEGAPALLRAVGAVAVSPA